MAIASAAEVRRLPRLAVIDVLRGVAIVAMVVYHAGFDLSYQGLIAVDVSTHPLWVALARITASTFLIIAGVSMVLSTRNGINWESYLRRLGVIVASAALVSLVTWLVFGPAFVFFGILHQIALASVLALPFLRLPAIVTLLAAAAILVIPALYASQFFDTPALWWVGLSTFVPETVDYVPVFPWFGMVLAGIAIGELLVVPAGVGVLGHWRPANPVTKALAVAGRWSLAIYLVHQVVLFGLSEAAVAARNLLVPAPAVELAPRTRFVGECLPSCTANPAVDAATCEARCGCVFDRLQQTDFSRVPYDSMTADQRTRFQSIVNACITGPKP
ncbi:DUF1624 domain-containing protein [soil metagenome]